MKKLLTALLLVIMVCTQVGAATIAVGPQPKPKVNVFGANNILLLKPSQIEKLTGKKLSVIDRIKLKIVQTQIKLAGKDKGEITDKQRRQAKWSLFLGLGSLALLFVPYIGLLGFAAAIPAVILGAKSLKGNTNTNGLIGIIAGSITLLAALVIIAVVAAWAAEGSWF